VSPTSRANSHLTSSHYGRHTGESVHRAPTVATMADRTLPSSTPPAHAAAFEAEPPVDLEGLAGAVRRGRRQVAVVVVLVTGVVLVVSLLAAPRFRASALIAEDPATAASADMAATDRRLATSRELVTAPAVLARAARLLPGETARGLAGRLSASVDPDSSILVVSARDGDPEQAARIADAVAATFLAERVRMERLVLEGAREGLERGIERERRAGATGATLEALRERLSELVAAHATAGSGLRLVQSAEVPSAPYAPQPLRSTILAFFAALFAALLLAVARDRLRTQQPDAQALSRVAGLPLIAALPTTGDASGDGPARRLAARLRLGRGGRSWAVDQAMIEEAALQASVRAALPARGQRAVLVHGAGRDDDPEPVAAGLARALSWAGHSTVLVRSEGPPGEPPAPDLPVVTGTDLDDELETIRRSDYRYVVVESPRLAAGSQLRLLARHVTAVVLVARLGRTSAADAAAARRLIDALGLRGLGLVVTCSAEEAAVVAREGFASPARPPGRPRAASQNNAHRADAASEPAALAR